MLLYVQALEVFVRVTDWRPTSPTAG